MKVLVQGLGHLGSVTAACLSSLRHEIIALDFDHQIVNDLKKNKPLFFEPKLQDLISRGTKSQNLKFISSINSSVKVDYLWITYDTPIDKYDNANIEFVMKNITKTLTKIHENVIVIISSQIPIGSIKILEDYCLKKLKKKFCFACIPENLRLGGAIYSFLNADRLIVGVRSKETKIHLSDFIKSISKNVKWMSIESAEMTKHSINAFLATSVSFINEISTICEHVGADSKEVEVGLKTETRIGPKSYLSPGSAFAGGTLARDLKYLDKIRKKFKLKTPLLSSVIISNNKHKEWVNKKLKSFFPNLKNKIIAIWGLAYKSGTNSLQRSISVELCGRLINKGAIIKVYDSKVKKFPKNWKNKIKNFSNPIEAVKNANVLVVFNKDNKYFNISEKTLSKVAKNVIILDANRVLKHLTKSRNFKYFSVGMSSK